MAVGPGHGPHVHRHPPEHGPAVPRPAAVRARLRRARRGAAGADEHRRRRPGRRAHRPGGRRRLRHPPPETTARRSPCRASGPHDPTSCESDDGFTPVILDLHTHSVRSDDGRAKVDNYCQWIQRKELPLDGIVLTEHRQFDDESDYRALEDQYGLLILKASEVETDYGHCLVFGVNDDLVHAFDFARIDNPLARCIDAANRCGAFAAPCHPGRKNVGLFAHYEREGPGRRASRSSRSTTAAASRARTSSRSSRPPATATAASAAATRTSSAASACAPPSSTDEIATIDDLVTALRAGRCRGTDMANGAVDSERDAARRAASGSAPCSRRSTSSSSEDRMLEWAVTCGETDPRFVDPDAPRLPGVDVVPDAHQRGARCCPTTSRDRVGPRHRRRQVDRVAPPDARRRPAARRRSRSPTSTPRPGARGRWCSSSTG